jgi:hypothetical protein
VHRKDLGRGYGSAKTQGRSSQRLLWGIVSAERAGADGVELGHGSIGVKMTLSPCRGLTAEPVDPIEELLRDRFATLWEREDRKIR